MNVNEVEIEFCVPCGLQAAAEKAGHALLSAYGEKIAGLRLIPSHGGVFRVGVAGERVFDKAGEGFDVDAIVARVGERLVPATTVHIET